MRVRAVQLIPRSSCTASLPDIDSLATSRAPVRLADNALLLKQRCADSLSRERFPVRRLQGYCQQQFRLVRVGVVRVLFTLRHNPRESG